MIRLTIILITIFIPMLLVGQHPEDVPIKDLKGGGYFTTNHKPFYVYDLPYAKGQSYILAQGYESDFSHKGEKSLDFKMKPGTPIHAAREGIVVDIQSDSNEGGMKKKYLLKGNHIIILHSDSTYGGYWHLQFNGVAVAVGDSIKKGQYIGNSGHTGYSAFPHLHFYVYQINADGEKITLPTLFKIKNDILCLRPGRKYESE